MPQRRTSPRPSAREPRAALALLDRRQIVASTGSASTSFGYGPFRLLPM